MTEICKNCHICGHREKKASQVFQTCSNKDCGSTAPFHGRVWLCKACWSRELKFSGPNSEFLGDKLKTSEWTCPRCRGVCCCIAMRRDCRMCTHEELGNFDFVLHCKPKKAFVNRSYHPTRVRSKPRPHAGRPRQHEQSTCSKRELEEPVEPGQGCPGSVPAAAAAESSPVLLCDPIATRLRSSQSSNTSTKTNSGARNSSSTCSSSIDALSILASRNDDAALETPPAFDQFLDPSFSSPRNRQLSLKMPSSASVHGESCDEQSGLSGAEEDTSQPTIATEACYPERTCPTGDLEPGLTTSCRRRRGKRRAEKEDTSLSSFLANEMASVENSAIGVGVCAGGRAIGPDGQPSDDAEHNKLSRTQGSELGDGSSEADGFSVSRMMASPKRDYLLLQEMGADSHYFFHRKEHTRSVLNTSASTCAAAESTSQSQSEKSSRSGALTALKDSPETSGTCTVASR